MSKIAYVPSIVVCLSQITQFTSSERNLLQVATTETEVAESVSRIHIVEKLIPNPMKHVAAKTYNALLVTSVSFRLTASPDTVNRASANGALSTLMLNDLDQLFSLILSIVCFAIKPSETAAIMKSMQNPYALSEEKISKLTYMIAPTTIPVNASADFDVGKALPRNRYSFSENTTGVSDFTAMNVSNGARCITSIPANNSAKKLTVSGMNAIAISFVRGSTSTNFKLCAMMSITAVAKN